MDTGQVKAALAHTKKEIDSLLGQAATLKSRELKSLAKARAYLDKADLRLGKMEKPHVKK